MKRTFEVIHPGRSAVCADDHERRVIACLQCVKCLNSGLVERNAAVAAGGFGAVLDLQFIGAHLIAAFVPVVGDNAVFINIQGSGCEIDIRPLECRASPIRRPVFRIKRKALA